MYWVALGAIVVGPVIFGRFQRQTDIHRRLQKGTPLERCSVKTRCASARLNEQQLWSQWKPNGLEWKSELKFDTRGNRKVPYLEVTHAP